MARKNPTNPEPPVPSVSPEKGIELIRRQLARAQELRASGNVAAGLVAWVTITREVLGQAFGVGAPEVFRFLNSSNVVVPRDPDPWGRNSDPRAFDARVQAALPLQQLAGYVQGLEALVGVLQVRVDVRGEARQDMPHDTAAVCENGHVISSHVRSHPETHAKFCSSCGARAVDHCAKCLTIIRGSKIMPEGGYVVDLWIPPRHCAECGEPFPWTAAKTVALHDAIDELDELQPEERQKLQDSIPDIISNTPKTEPAALRFKKVFAKLGKGAGEMLHKVLVDVGAEVAKKSMGL